MNNRSIPNGTFAPSLSYTQDVGTVIEWLTAAFGVTERFRAGTNHAQIAFGDGGCLISGGRDQLTVGNAQYLTISVQNVDEIYARVVAFGGEIITAPTEFMYGERQFSARDLGGHIWHFSQSIRDVDPTEWGALLADDNVDTGKFMSLSYPQMYHQWIAIWNGEDLALENIFHRDVIVRQAPNELQGIEHIREMVMQGRAPFDPLTSNVDVEPVHDEHMLAARWKCQGTYRGGMPNVTAESGTEIVFGGTDIWRFSEGLVSDYWVSSDGLWLMDQLNP